MERANELSGGIPFTLGFLAYLQGRANQHDAARAILEGLRQASVSRYVSPFASALAYIGLEEWDDAIHWLDEAIEQRDPLDHADQELQLPRPDPGGPEVRRPAAEDASVTTMTVRRLQHARPCPQAPSSSDLLTFFPLHAVPSPRPATIA